MPSIRFLASKRYTYVVTIIFSLGKIIPTYSYCVLKGLVYIAITALSSRQPFSYAKCTKSNMRSSCDIKLMSNTKYKLLAYFINL